MSVRERLDAGRATTEDAMELLDSLEPVDVGFMIGNWKGEGFHTNHPMDGLLEAYHWYGKRFESPRRCTSVGLFNTSRRRCQCKPRLYGAVAGLDGPCAHAKVSHGGSYFPDTYSFSHNVSIQGEVAHDNLSGQVERNHDLRPAAY